MFHKSYPVAAALILASCLGPAAAHADIIFNSFGPGMAFSNGGGGYPISGGAAFIQAVRFIPSAAYSVSSVQAAMFSTGGNGFSSLTMKIVPDAGGQPGSVPVWTSASVIVQPTNAALYTYVTASSSGALAAGQPYWLVMDGPLTSGNAANAVSGQPPVVGTRAMKQGASAWTVLGSDPLPAVRIDGALLGACCNRNTGGCVVIDSVTCATLGLRFDGNGATCTAASCRACPADFNHSGTLGVQDIFDFLAAYFAGCP